MALSTHAVGHSIPTGSLVTVPSPLRLTVSTSDRPTGGGVVDSPASKRAVADAGPPRTNVQIELVPEHAPLQPTKCDFLAGSGSSRAVAVSVTSVIRPNDAVHVCPQSSLPSGAVDRIVP